MIFFLLYYIEILIFNHISVQLIYNENKGYELEIKDMARNKGHDLKYRMRDEGHGTKN